MLLTTVVITIRVVLHVHALRDTFVYMQQKIYSCSIATDSTLKICQALEVDSFLKEMRYHTASIILLAVVSCATVFVLLKTDLVDSPYSCEYAASLTLANKRGRGTYGKQSFSFVVGGIVCVLAHYPGSRYGFVVLCLTIFQTRMTKMKTLFL
jgi:hypothetical protein